ncbi:MAG: mechanosensitive ion channel family protein [Clostridia bacterium]|nr:mechanosensitive ion channel family protein [Clostridia bacterium]
MDWNEFWNMIGKWFATSGLSILTGIGILIAGFIVIKIIRIILRKFLHKTKTDGLGQRFIERAITVVLYIFLFLSVLQLCGIPITGLIAAFSAVALAVSLALQDSIASLANGVIIIFTKPFKQNDVIRYNGDFCRVREIRLFNTLVDTYDNRRLIIPNKDIVNYTIENFSSNETRRVAVKFEVSHTTDLDVLRKVCLQTMQNHPLVIDEPEPILILTEIEKDGIAFEARCWTLAPNYCDTLFGLNENIYNELKRNNIVIAKHKLEITNNNNKEILPVSNSNHIVRGVTKAPPAIIEEFDPLKLEMVSNSLINPKLIKWNELTKSEKKQLKKEIKHIRKAEKLAKKKKPIVKNLHKNITVSKINSLVLLQDNLEEKTITEYKVNLS